MSAPTLKQTPEKRTEQLTFSCSFQSLVGLSSAAPIWWDSKLLLNSVAFVLSVLPVLVIIFCDTCFFLLFLIMSLVIGVVHLLNVVFRCLSF